MTSAEAHGTRRTARLLDVVGRRPALSLFLGLLVVYLATAHYTAQQSTDALSALFAAWQFSQHGNLHLDGFTGLRHMLWLFPGAGHHLVTNRFPGVIFVAVPLYWIAGLTGGAQSQTFYPAAVTAALVTAVAMTGLFVVLRRLVGQRLAVVATLVAALCTGTWTVSAAALWTHGPDQLWLVLLMLGLAAGRYRLAGLALVPAELTRPHLVFVGIAIAGYLLLREGRRSRRTLVDAVAVSAAMGAGLGLLLAYNTWIYGRLTVWGGYGEHVSAGGVGLAHLPSNVAGLLVSPERGIFIWSPFLLLLLPGLRRAWRAAPGWVRACAIAGLAYQASQVWLISFRGGDGFASYRTPLEGLTLAAPLLVLAWRHRPAVGWLPRAMAVLVSWSFALHAIGAAPMAGVGGVHSAWTTFFTALEFEKTPIGATVGLVVSVLVITLIVRLRRHPLLSTLWREQRSEPVELDVPRPGVGDPFAASAS